MINCPQCGKLRKDIVTDKVKYYSFGAVAVLIILTLGRLIGNGMFTEPSGFMGLDARFSWQKFVSSPIGWVFAIAFAASVGVSLYYYLKVSQKLRTLWWL